MKRFSFTLALFFLSSTSNADYFLHFWEDEHQDLSQTRIRLNAMYYTTQYNFESAGGLNSPSSLTSYLRNQDDLTLNYGLFKKLSLYGRLSWAFVNLNSSLRSGNSFGLADQSVGVNFRILDGNAENNSLRETISVDLQAQVDFPGYNTSFSDLNRLPYLGDGSTDFTVGAFTYFPLSSGLEEQWMGTLGAGYTQRTLGFSAAIPWTAGIKHVPRTHGFIGGLLASGLISTNTDTLVTESGGTRISSGSGGSLITGAMNPSLFQIKIQAGYKVNYHSEFLINATQSIWGQSSPSGVNISLGFQTTFGNPEPSESVSFKDYSTEAVVTKVNDRLNLIKIDQGSDKGIRVGQIFDIFTIKKEGVLTEAIARSEVTSVKSKEAALEIKEFFKQVSIEEGFKAQLLIQ